LGAFFLSPLLWLDLSIGKTLPFVLWHALCIFTTNWTNQLSQQGTHGNDLNFLKEFYMEPTSMMRVNAHPSSYGGRGSTQQDRQHQRRQKKLALFDAIEQGHLEASKHALKLLMNFDQTLSVDAQFVRLSKALDAGSLYLSQQIVREIKTKLINPTALATHTTQALQTVHTPHPLRPYLPDGTHLVDTQA
jgi:hypothetical protein